MKTAKTDYKPLVLHRTFDVSAARVWEAWTDAEQFKQWWGPKNYSCPRCDIDFHVGGKFFASMRSADGKEMFGTGKYTEVIPTKKIVFIDNFADKDGNVISPEEAGMPGDWSQELIVTIDLEEKDGHTHFKLTHTGIPPEMSEDCVHGWEETLDKLGTFLSAKGRTTM